MDIQFYHLLTTPLEVALPKLAAIAYERGLRACIVAEVEMHTVLDAALWTYQPNSFLPHGVMDEQAVDHPILITDAPSVVNGAKLLIITNGMVISETEQSSYERIFDVFNGNHTGALMQARERWKTYLDAGIPLAYVKQRTDGSWEKLKEANKESV